jgi:hypothetical protein
MEDFAMVKIASALLTLLAIQLFSGIAWSQQATIRDCIPVLTKDYYSYAKQNNLREDFLKSIDSESWEKWQQSNDLNAFAIFSGGAFSLSDKYSDFDEKRSKYLETVHYNRTQQQALSILQITTGARAYAAYEACLVNLGSGAPLRVWASSEVMTSIDLRIKYVNPPSKAKITLVGVVEGGAVTGAPTGRLWTGGKAWGVNQEKPFKIMRSSGASKTAVTIIPDDGSTPIRLELSRADAVLTLTYVGVTDVLVAPNRSVSSGSPNNDHNRGNCPNQVGRHDGFCVSRTHAQIAVLTPNFLSNPRGNYIGDNCPYCTAAPATVSPDGLSADFYLDNWGSPVTVALTVDQYEHVSSVQCGANQTLPVVFKQAVVLTALNKCLPIAVLHWKRFTESQSEGTFHFGDKDGAEGKVTADSITPSGSALIIGYKIDP